MKKKVEKNAEAKQLLYLFISVVTKGQFCHDCHTDLPHQRVSADTGSASVIRVTRPRLHGIRPVSAADSDNRHGHDGDWRGCEHCDVTRDHGPCGHDGAPYGRRPTRHIRCGSRKGFDTW